MSYKGKNAFTTNANVIDCPTMLDIVFYQKKRRSITHVFRFLKVIGLLSNNLCMHTLELVINAIPHIDDVRKCVLEGKARADL